MATVEQIEQVRLNIDDLPIEINNLIDRGNCESAIPPLVMNEISAYTLNCTWERSSEQKYKDNYSYKLLKSVDPARAGFVNDAPNFLKLHGFEPGNKYTLSFVLYLPALLNDGFIFSNVKLIFSYFYGVTHVLVEREIKPAEIYGNWQKLETTIILPLDTTGVYIGIEAFGTGNVLYVDDVNLYIGDPVNFVNSNDFSDEIISDYIDFKDSVIYATYKLIDVLIIRLRKEILKQDDSGTEKSVFFDLTQRLQILENVRGKYEHEYNSEIGNTTGRMINSVKPVVAGGMT